MLHALSILVLEAVCGLVLVLVSHAGAMLWRCTDTLPSAIRSIIMVVVNLILICIVVGGLAAPVVLLGTQGSLVWWLLFCCYVCAVIPFLWLTRNHPDWIWDEVPEWARIEPLDTIRAPWYNNWRGSFVVGATLLGAIPFVAMSYHDQSLAEAIWTGVQAGIVGTIGVFPILVGFTLLFPIRIYPVGIRGFTEAGLSISVPWSSITEISESHSYGTQGVSVSVDGSEASLWLPQTVVNRAAFRRAVAPQLDEGHVLLRTIGSVGPPRSNAV